MCKKRILRPEQIEDFECRYLGILVLANQEYNDNPPCDYYRKKYNLSVKRREYRDAVLCFLHNPEVDFTNNTSENCLGKAKGHLVVEGTFRDFTTKSAEDYCVAMSVMEAWKLLGEDILVKIQKIFVHRSPPKHKKVDSDDDNGNIA